jgi:hypothetical protein
MYPRIVITHPEYYVPNLNDADIAILAKEGVFMEFCAVSCGPMTPAASIERVKQMIDVVGPEHAVIASDTGQPFSPRPPEALRVFRPMPVREGCERIRHPLHGDRQSEAALGPKLTPTLA